MKETDQTASRSWWQVPLSERMNVLRRQESQVFLALSLVIGALTGPGAVPPEPEWVQNIIDFADEHSIPVFLKDNLDWPEKRQEFPRTMNE